VQQGRGRLHATVLTASHHLLGGYAFIGEGIPVGSRKPPSPAATSAMASGMQQAFRHRRLSSVTGTATNVSSFECLNHAVAWKLPHSLRLRTTSGDRHAHERATSEPEIWRKAAAFRHGRRRGGWAWTGWRFAPLGPSGRSSGQSRRRPHVAGVPHLPVPGSIPWPIPTELRKRRRKKPFWAQRDPIKPGRPADSAAGWPRPRKLGHRSGDFDAEWLTRSVLPVRLRPDPSELTRYIWAETEWPGTVR